MDDVEGRLQTVTGSSRRLGRIARRPANGPSKRAVTARTVVRAMDGERSVLNFSAPALSSRPPMSP